MRAISVGLVSTQNGIGPIDLPAPWILTSALLLPGVREVCLQNSAYHTTATRVAGIREFPILASQNGTRSLFGERDALVHPVGGVNEDGTGVSVQ